jgi:pyrroline-5-carboxylate reductase
VGEALDANRSALQRDFEVLACADNRVATAKASVIVVAVKPQDAAAVLSALEPQLREQRPLVLSVAAGIRILSLKAWCGSAVPIVRAMPNRPALVGAGITGLYATDAVGASERAVAEQVMRAVGAVVWLKAESDLDVVTALSGSGPAYFFLLAELMTEAAIKLGLEPLAARTLAVETLYGAGRLAHESHGDLARLRAEVTSKGGTTEAALGVFNDADLRGIVARAITAATQRSRDLAAQFGGTHAR